MIYSKYRLDNGLNVVIQQDDKVRSVVLDVVYNVGSKNDPIGKFGIAHLYEHFMFCGSVNVDSYDKELDSVGGNNNAYTCDDITNYYCTVPYNNLETALWLESDRMLQLKYSQESLDIQRNVVIGELKEVYYSSPYSDQNIRFLPLAYTKDTPYSHPTIGNIKDLESVTMEDMKIFTNKYYQPSNATVIIVGNVELDKTLALVKKYFGNIPSNGSVNIHDYGKYSFLNSSMTVKKDIPSEILLLGYNVCGRVEENYYPTLVLAQVIGSGQSSILYRSLVEEKRLFNNINIELTETFGPGLLIINGEITNNVSIAEAYGALKQVLRMIVTNGISEHDLEKAKNSLRTEYVKDLLNLTDRADMMATCAAMGNVDKVNIYIEKISRITKDNIGTLIADIFVDEKATMLAYERI